MLTKVAICWIYAASYFLDYIILFLITICKKIGEYLNDGVDANNSFFKYCDLGTYMIWCILLALILLSLSCIFFIKKLDMNTRIKVKPGENIVWDMAGYVFAYVITVLTIIFTDYWLIISGFIFWGVGVFYIKAEKVYCSPLFIFPMGYKIFKCGDYVVITDYTFDELRLMQTRQKNEIQARALQGRGYLVLKNKNEA